jgi:Tfp pilus assembly protein PilF
MFMEDGNLRAAIKPLDEIIKINDRHEVHNGGIYLRRALAHISVGRLEFAEADLNNMLRKEPKSHDAAYLMGVIAEKERRGRDAVKWFRKALKMKPDFWLAKMKLKSH